MTTQNKLTKEVLTPKENKLPNKEERKKEELWLQEKNEKRIKEIKKLQDVCEEFFNETILDLDIPFGVVEQHLSEFMRTYCVIYKAGSTKKKEADKLYREVVETPIKELNVDYDELGD